MYLQTKSCIITLIHFAKYPISKKVFNAQTTQCRLTKQYNYCTVSVLFGTCNIHFITNSYNRLANIICWRHAIFYANKCILSVTVVKRTTQLEHFANWYRFFNFWVNHMLKHLHMWLLA